MSTSTTEYRADIDGMRAVAVLAVVVFHLSHSFLPGGYLGVDIFFVLSGYLITSIVWQEAVAGQFSLATFYERRVRRIVPALLFVLAATTAVAFILLLPSDLLGYSESLLATLGFVANIYFWRDTYNYFSRQAEQQPLLHLWSLGVEEQFYILFPLLLLACARFWPQRAAYIVAGVALLSFVVNIAMLRLGAVSPAFFLLPARVWELAFGAVLALIPAQSRIFPKAVPLATTASSLGVLLVFFGILLPPRYWPAEIPTALPVVLGTGLIIAAGQSSSSPVSKALGLAPMVHVGKISYSLYLWHWPVVVFAKYYFVRMLGVAELLLALMTMLILAVCSWHFVERPFRDRRLPSKVVLMTSGIGAVVLAGAVAMLQMLDGMPARFTGPAAAINEAVGTNYACPLARFVRVGPFTGCELNLPSHDPSDAEVVVVGNSHAQMYSPAFESIFLDKREAALSVAVPWCLPTTQANLSVDCLERARNVFAAISVLPRLRTVVIGTTWWHSQLVDETGTVVDNMRSQALLKALDELVDQYRRRNLRVILIGPLAEPGWDVASVVGRSLAFGHQFKRPLFMPRTDFESRFRPVFDHFQSTQGFTFVRPDLIQCRSGRCEYLMDGRSLFADSNHLATGELYRFIPLLKKALEDIDG